jgi:hypothetical protein
METLGSPLWPVAKELLLGTMLPAILLAVVAYVLTINYRSLVRESFAPDLLQDENVIDQIRIPRRLVLTETWLSNQRIIQARTSWLLSRRRLQVLALEDINTVRLERRLGVAIFLVAWAFWGTLNPVTLGLLLLGLEHPLVAIRFSPSVSDMPLARITCLTFFRSQFSDVMRFWRNAVGQWSERRTHKGLSAPIVQPRGLEHLFGWGRTVWCCVAVYFVAGVLQRSIQGHVSFDDLVFLPLSLALPAAVSARSLRDGVWCAVLGFAALFTVLYPTRAMTAGWLDDYHGRGLVVQQVGILATMIATAVVSSLLVRVAHSSLAVLAPAVWLALVAVDGHGSFHDLALYAKVCLAMCAVAPLSLLDRMLLAGR